MGLGCFMGSVQIKNKKITLLSNEDMAGFIHRMYRTIDVKSIMRLSRSAADVRVYTAELSEFLVQYAISTGDISNNAICKISQKFIQNIQRHDELNSNVQYNMGRMAKEILFEEIVMPEIIQYWGDKLQLNHKLSLKDVAQIIDAVYLQSKNNVFHTHSFNYAILPEVKQYGLDISREKFKPELLRFAPAGRQVYQTGVLNTCELSDTTFGYASIVPERVKNTFWEPGIEQRDGEKLSDYLMRCVDHKLANLDATYSEKCIMKNDAYKIIDFYYGHTKASIAVIRQDKGIVEKDVNVAEWMASAIFSFVHYPHTNEIFSTLSKGNREQIKGIKGTEPDALELLEKALNDAGREGDKQKMAVSKIKEYLCGYCMCRYALNNFTRSMGDGYVIREGKIDRSKFAIATYEDPYKLYPFYKSRENKEEILR